MNPSKLDDYLPPAEPASRRPRHRSVFVILNAALVTGLLLLIAARLLAGAFEKASAATTGSLREIISVMIVGALTRFGALLLLLLLVYDLVYLWRWLRSLRFASDLTCPTCRSLLRRRHRRTFDRIISRLFPVRRYSCRKCATDFMVPGHAERKMPHIKHPAHAEEKAGNSKESNKNGAIYRLLDDMMSGRDKGLVKMINDKLPERNAKEIEESLARLRLRPHGLRSTNGNTTGAAPSADADEHAG